MGMREELQTILNGIAQARKEPLLNHPLARHITHDWHDAASQIVDDPSYKITGSPGKGHWAHTVWLAIFDRLITESAQHGFYLVYLVPSNGDRAYLSLNQATEEIYNRVGGRHYRQVLEDTAARDRGLLEGEETYGLTSARLDLGGTSRLTRGYESGNILAVEYLATDLPDEAELEADLTRLLLLYRSLVEARDQVEENEEAAPPENLPSGQVEARHLRWHRRAERSQSLSALAKKIHGTRCQVQACGKDLSEIYGELASGYIEAHHLTPFAKLEGRPTELDPKNDFAVVCPDCHRMLHRRLEPYSLEEISTRISASSL